MKVRSKNWANAFVAYLTEKETEAHLYSARTQFNSERQVYEAVITVRKHGIDTDYFINFDFVMGNEFAKDYRIWSAGEWLTRRGRLCYSW